jgi:hypothetical protein
MRNGDGENIFSMCQGDKDNMGAHNAVGRHQCGGEDERQRVWHWGIDRVGRVSAALGYTVQLGYTVDMGWPVHSLSNIPILFQFKSIAPSSKIRNMIFLLLKLLQTLHADRKIQI